MDQNERGFFDWLEAFYLSAMRMALLIFATLLFAYAAVAGIFSLYRVSKSPYSVVEAKADVKVADIIPQQEPSETIPENTTSDKSNTPQSEPSVDLTPFQKHTWRMYAIWSKKFEIYRKKDDPKLSASEFAAWYREALNEFQTPEMCSFENCSENEWAVVKPDFDKAEATIAAAADDANLKQRMASFKRGGTNYETESFDRIYVTLNYNFWARLADEREANKGAADAERAKIETENAAGGVGLVRAGWAFAALLSLLFGFLLVAVERHQRRMAGDIDKIKVGLKNK